MNFKSFFFTIIVLFLVRVTFTQDTIQITDPATLSIDVKDTDIRDVIRMISKGYNLNILLDNSISGKITLHLTNVPIMEGLRSIAESNGLQLIKENSVYKIQKATAEQKSLVRYADGKLTIDVQNVDVKDFIKELSSKTAISIVPDSKVEGIITGKLFQVPLEDGLRAILEGNGFKVTKRRNIYQVVKNTESTSGYSGPRQSYNSQNSKFFVDYSNGLVSLDVSNGDLEDIIRAISEQSDVEIITYGSIKSEINAKLTNAPLTEALALLLGGTRFTFVQKDNVILIGDRNTATPSGQALSKSELIHLKHIKADNIPPILPKDIPSTNVRVIKEQNALLISGTSEDIVSAKEFINTIDIPTPQVRIDAVIVEFKDNLDRGSGFRFGKSSKLMDSSFIITPFQGNRYYPEKQNFEMGLSGKLIKQIFNGLSFGLIEKIPDNWFGMLYALETQDKAKVLAQPSIMTLNGNKASIDVSETQYFKVTTGVGENQTSRFQPIKFGITLDIVPWISQSGQITAEITPNVSNSEKTNAENYPNVSARSITTTVRLNDGETLILGGLIKNQETQSNYKVPFLGSLPIIGTFFRQSSKTKIKSNLVVFITPHIITDNNQIDLEREIEKFELYDKNILEKAFYNGKNKLLKRLSKDSDSVEQKVDSVVIQSDSLHSVDTSAVLTPDSGFVADTLQTNTSSDSTVLVPRSEKRRRTLSRRQSFINETEEK